MALNLRQIEVFRAVMTTGSVSGAAQLLFVSQPAISRLLAHTEQRLGFALFERVKGRLYATPEAKKLCSEVEEVYATVQRVNALARELGEHRDGVLNIVSTHSVGQMLIPAAIARFRQDHPQVKLTFRCLNYEAVVDRVLHHKADLGVTISPIQHPNLQGTPLGQGRLVCIVPTQHPLAQQARVGVADLLPYPMIGYQSGSPFCSKIEHLFERAGAAFRTVLEVGSPQNACALVQAGVGIGIVDEFSVRSWPSSQIAVRPLDGAPSIGANLVHLRFEPMSGIALAFSDALQRLMRNEGFEDAMDEAPAGDNSVLRVADESAYDSAHGPRHDAALTTA